MGGCFVKSTKDLRQEFTCLSSILACGLVNKGFLVKNMRKSSVLLTEKNEPFSALQMRGGPLSD